MISVNLLSFFFSESDVSDPGGGWRLPERKEDITYVTSKEQNSLREVKGKPF